MTNFQHTPVAKKMGIMCSRNFIQKRMQQEGIKLSEEPWKCSEKVTAGCWENRKWRNCRNPPPAIMQAKVSDTPQAVRNLHACSLLPQVQTWAPTSLCTSPPFEQVPFTGGIIFEHFDINKKS